MLCTSVMADLPFVGRPRMRSTWSSATLSGGLQLARASNDDTFQVWVTYRRSTRRTSTAVLPCCFCGSLVTARRSSDERARDQCAAQLAARRDPELREHSVE